MTSAPDPLYDPIGPVAPPEYVGITTWRQPTMSGLRRRRKAQPPQTARLYGEHTPVTVTLTYRGGPMGWVEVSYYQGRFWRPCTTSVYQLLIDIIHGDVVVTDNPAPRSARARRRRAR